MTWSECVASCEGPRGLYGEGGGATIRSTGGPCPEESTPYPMRPGCSCPGVLNASLRCDCRSPRRSHGRCYCCPTGFAEDPRNHNGTSRIQGRRIYRFFIRFEDVPVGEPPRPYCGCALSVTEMIRTRKLPKGSVVSTPAGDVRTFEWFTTTSRPEYIDYSLAKFRSGQRTSMAGFYDYLLHGHMCMPNQSREIMFEDAPSHDAKPIVQVLRFTTLCPDEWNPCENHQAEIRIWYHENGRAEVTRVDLNAEGNSGTPSSGW
jgi:hypothetical protein